MERRKDTQFRGERLPSEYLNMIRGVFGQNFSEKLKGKGKNREAFVVFGEVYPDEILVAVSLKNPVNLRMTTAYASLDFPPPSLKGESGGPALMTNSTSDAVQMSVNSCIDVIASFFQTYFDEDRPVDYDQEYRQDWVTVDIDKTTKVYLRINRDNLELEAASDDFLAQNAALEDRAEAIAEESEHAEPTAQKSATQEVEESSSSTETDDSDLAEVEEEEDPALELPSQRRKRKKGTTLH